MKYYKLLHRILGVFPLIWFVTFLTVVVTGVVRLRHIPIYGKSPDPYSLEINILGRIHLIAGLLAYVAFFLWLLLFIFGLFFFRKKFSLDKLSTIFFFIGVIGFFVFKYIFTGVFQWVLD
jgi:hypothetical protein